MNSFLLPVLPVRPFPDRLEQVCTWNRTELETGPLVERTALGTSDEIPTS